MCLSSLKMSLKTVKKYLTRESFHKNKVMLQQKELKVDLQL